MHKRQLCPKLILAPTQCECRHPLTNKMMMIVIILPNGVEKPSRTYMIMMVIRRLLMVPKIYLLAETYFILFPNTVPLFLFSLLRDCWKFEGLGCFQPLLSPRNRKKNAYLRRKKEAHLRQEKLRWMRCLASLSISFFHTYLNLCFTFCYWILYTDRVFFLLVRPKND